MFDVTCVFADVYKTPRRETRSVLSSKHPVAKKKKKERKMTKRNRLCIFFSCNDVSAISISFLADKRDNPTISKALQINSIITLHVWKLSSYVSWRILPQTFAYLDILNHGDSIRLIKNRLRNKPWHFFFLIFIVYFHYSKTTGISCIWEV